MTEPTKEQRLAELLKNPPQARPTELPGGERPRKESRELPEAAGKRKCPNVHCELFALEHDILVKGIEVVSYMLDPNGDPSDKVENSNFYYEPSDPADGICPGCQMQCGCLPPGSRSVLEGVLNPTFGIRNDRDAVLAHRKKLDLPKPVWAVEEANREVQKAVKE